MIERVKVDDPVRGNKGIVWCNTSNLALGMALEISGRIVEDTAWIRKKGDLGHIIESCVKRCKLSIEMGNKVIGNKNRIMTMMSWVQSVCTMEKRVRINFLN